MGPSDDILQSIEIILAQLEDRPPVRLARKKPETRAVYVNPGMNLPPVR